MLWRLQAILVVTAVLWILLCRIAGRALFIEETSDHEHPAEEKHKRLLGDPSAHTDKPTRSENLVRLGCRGPSPVSHERAWDQRLGSALCLLQLTALGFSANFSANLARRFMSCTAAAGGLSLFNVAAARDDALTLCFDMTCRWGSCGSARPWACSGASWASSARTPSPSTCTRARITIHGPSVCRGPAVQHHSTVTTTGHMGG